MNTNDEQGDSLKITKTEGRQVVANFDRGRDRQSTTDAAHEIIDFLAAGIAKHTFGK